MEGLRVKNLSHRFGYAEILHNINFELQKGESIAIIGPSGGGKSTLLKLCAGLLDVHEGGIENRFSHSAIAFQEPRLLPWKNVIDNILLGLLSRAVPYREKVERARRIALSFGLEERDFVKFPKDLSGGMRQRVSFARAIVGNPSLLFLDEPFSALDIGIKKELATILLHYLKEQESSLFLITHDPMEAIKFSDKILLLKADPGEIIHTFSLEIPPLERSETYLMEQNAKLLSDPRVIQTFTWELR
ncbi:MAG: ABC transporter ATP-binding protein [Wolinella sp.]